MTTAARIRTWLIFNLKWLAIATIAAATVAPLLAYATAWLPWVWAWPEHLSFWQGLAVGTVITIGEYRWREGQARD